MITKVNNGEKKRINLFIITTVLLSCIFAIFGVAFMGSIFDNGSVAYAETGSSIVYWDPIAGSDTNDGLTQITPKLEFDDTDGVMSIIGDGSVYGTIKMLGNAKTVSADTTLNGNTTNGNITLERDEAYTGNLFIVANGKNLLLQNMLLPSTSKVAVSVKNNAVLWLENVSLGTSSQDVIVLEGGYLALVGSSTNTYVLSSTKTADGTVLVKANGSMLDVNNFSLISSLSDDYHLAKNSNGDICIYKIPEVPEMPVTTYGNIVYISDNGVDTNTGAVASQPVKTIAKAVSIAQAHDEITKLGIAGEINIAQTMTWSSTTFSNEFTDIVVNGGSILVNASFSLNMPMTVISGTGIKIIQNSFTISKNGSITVNNENAIGVDNMATSSKAFNVGAAGRLTANAGIAYQISGTHALDIAQLQYITAINTGKTILIKKDSNVSTNATTTGLTFYLSSEYATNDKIITCSIDCLGATFIDNGGNDITSSIAFLSNGLYWVNDYIYVDDANGNDANNGRIPSSPVKTMAQSITNANIAGLTKIAVIGTYDVTSSETISASGITISSNTSIDTTVVSVASEGILTLTSGTIAGKININGSLDYVGGEITNLNVYGTVTLHHATPTTHVISILSDLDNPIVESDDMDGTENFIIKVYDSMIGHTLVTTNGTHDATYTKSSDTTTEISLSATTGTIIVNGTFIYVSNTGNDDNNGETSETPVKTIMKALELLGTHENYAIMLINTVSINDIQTWKKGTLSWTPIIYRGFTNGCMVNVNGESASLTLENIIIDGRNLAETTKPALFVSNAQLTVNAGAIIRNNISSSNGGGMYLYASTLTLNGGTISGNSAANGGGIYLEESTLIMNTGTIIQNNISSSNGGGMYLSLSTLTMNGGTISGNTAKNSNVGGGGGGIYAYTSTITMLDSTISNNTAENGGAILLRATNYVSYTFIMENCIISNNVAISNGGGIYSTGATTGGESFYYGGSIINNVATLGGGIYLFGTATLYDNINITGNTATSFGGGIYVTSSTLTMYSGTISGNTATQSGGGVYIKDFPGMFTMHGGTISCNSSKKGGGVYVINSSVFTINDGEISYNTASGSGGGVNASYSSTLTLNNGRICDNTATEFGGGVFSSSSLFTINNGSISNNTANNYGGGIYTSSTTLEIIGGSISHNTANKYGGGVYSTNTTIIISDGTISNNIANEFGGGMYVQSSIMTIYGGMISGNSATIGGGVYVYFSSTITMNEGIISDNSATNNGGGVYVYNSSTIIINGGIISGNSATYGGGVYVYKSSTITMNEGMIFNNTAENRGGGILVSESTITLNGCTITANAANIGNAIFLMSSKKFIITSTDNRIDGDIFCSFNSDLDASIYVGGALTDSSVKYTLVLNKSNVGRIAVLPYGYSVTDASQYLTNFTAKYEDGTMLPLGKIGNNIGIVNEKYIDGVHGNDANDGSSPSLARKTLANTEATVNYIVNTVTIDDSVVLSNSISLVRYTGWAVNARYYATLNGSLVEVVTGGTLTLSNNIGFSGKRYSTDSNFGGQLITVNGGTLILNHANAIDTYFAPNGAVHLANGSFITQGETAYTPSSPLTIALESAFATNDVVVSNSIAYRNYTLVGSALNLYTDNTNVIIGDAAPDVYYVSSSGSDDNDGTESFPYSTMTKAIESATGTGGRIVILDTLTISSNTSLTFTNNFTVEAADGVTDIITITSEALTIKGYVNIISGTIVLNGGTITAATSNSDISYVATPIKVSIAVASPSTTTTYIRESGSDSYFNVSCTTVGYDIVWSNGSYISCKNCKLTQSYYVNQMGSGNDENDGSYLYQYKTLTKAYSSLRNSGGTIYITGGYKVSGFNTLEISSTFVTENGTTIRINNGKNVKIVWDYTDETPNMFTASDYATLKFTDLYIDGNMRGYSTMSALIHGEENANVILDGVTVTDFTQMLLSANKATLKNVSANTIKDENGVSVLAQSATSRITLWEEVDIGIIDFDSFEGAKLLIASSSVNNISLDLGFTTNGVVIADTSLIGTDIASEYIGKILLKDTTVSLAISANLDEIEIENAYDLERSIVTFNYNDGVTPNEVFYATSGTNILYDTEAAETGNIVNVTIPSRTNYTFGGWKNGETLYWDADGSPIVDEINENITLTAEWIAHTTAITLISNNENANGTCIATYDSTILSSLIAPTAEDGYELVGYYFIGFTSKLINADGTLVAAIDGYTDTDAKWIYQDSALILVAKWNIKTYTVMYNTGSGTGTLPDNGTKTHDIAYTINTSLPLTKTGYTQIGWTTGAENTDGTGAITSYTDNANVTLYPVWEIITYTVTYNIGNGTGTLPEEGTKIYNVTYTIDTSLPLTKTGYTQIGWTTDAESTDGTGAITSYTDNANITLYPVWEINEPTITAKSGNYSETYDDNTHNISVTATHSLGSTALSYQWYKGGTSDSNVIVGATSSFYAVKDVETDTDYYCKVTVVDGTHTASVFSESINVTISPLAISIDVAPTINGITFIGRQPNDGLSLEGGIAKRTDTLATITGSFSFEYPDTEIIDTDTELSILFEPENENFATATCSVNIIPQELTVQINLTNLSVQFFTAVENVVTITVNYKNIVNPYGNSNRHLRIPLILPNGYDYPDTISATKGGNPIDITTQYYSTYVSYINGISYSFGNGYIDIECNEITDNFVFTASSRQYDAWIDSANRATEFTNIDIGNKILKITSAAELALFAYNTRISDSTYAGYTVILENDIDLTGHIWTSIRNNNIAIFDGNNHTISGMTMLRTNSIYLMDQGYGLFDKVKTLTICNLRVTGSISLTSVDSNISSGYNDSYIYVGGIVGIRPYTYAYNDPLVIYNVSSDVDISITSSSSSSFGNIYVGGIVGYYAGQQETPDSIFNSYATGNITIGPNVKGNVGGICGLLIGEHIFNSYYGGTIINSNSDELMVGGIVGFIDYYRYYIYPAKVENSYYLQNNNYNGYGKKHDNIAESTVEITAISQENAVADGSASSLRYKLNNWVLTQDDTKYYAWINESETNDGMPIFGNSYTEYTISVFNGESNFIEDIVYTTSTENEPTLPVLEASIGYEFNKWTICYIYDEESNWTLDADYIYVPGRFGNIAITANWSPISYGITYEGMEGALCSTQPSTHTYDTNTTVSDATKVGYTFDGWQVNGGTATTNLTLAGDAYTADITLTATWHANTNTAYKVEHYFENFNGEFVLESTKNQNLTGTTDTIANATYLSGNNLPAGFESDDDNASKISTGNIAANGSLVLKLYYLRIRYTVTILANESDYGSVSVASVASIPYGTVLSVDRNSVTVGGTTVVATPTQYNAQYTYAFSDWTNGTATISGAITVTANFTRTVNKYTITWKNGETTLETDENVEYGAMPSYDSATPTKTATAQYSYTFSGWNTVISTVTGHTTYTAQFSSTTNQYTYTFYDENGTTELKKTTVDYGTAITSPTDPNKAATAQYTYSFDGWYTAQTAGTKVNTFGNLDENGATYYARYSSVINKYTVIWKNSETTLETDENVAYGAMPNYDGATPVKAENDTYIYEFVSWSPAIKAVNGNATYTAIFKEKAKAIFTPNINPENPEDQDRIKGEVESDDGFEPNTTLIVKVIAIETAVTTLAAPEGKQLANTYNATLYVNNVATAPNGEITIRIAKPASLQQADNYTIIIVEDGVAAQKIATVDGDYLVFTTTVLGDFAILTDIVDTTLNLLWLIILLAIINIMELIAIGLLLKRNSDDKKKTKGTKTYSVVGLSTLFAAAIVPKGQIIAIIILGVSAIILACIIVYLALKRYKAKQETEQLKSINKASSEAAQSKTQEKVIAINATKKVNDSIDFEQSATEPGDDLKDIIASAHRTGIVKTGINKKAIADYIEQSYEDKAITNRRENYTSTGLPLADTHYVVINGKKTCFAFVYELDNGKVFLLLKTTEAVAKGIKESHYNIELSRFPKATVGQWYSLIIDDTFNDEKELFDIITMVIASYNKQ